MVEKVFSFFWGWLSGMYGTNLHFPFPAVKWYGTIPVESIDQNTIGKDLVQ